MRNKTLEIRQYIVDKLEEHPIDIVRVISEKFSITRQSSFRHIQKLEIEGIIKSEGIKRNKRYFLVPVNEKEFSFVIAPGLQEDRIWRESIEPLLGGIKENVKDICFHGFSEMFNNVMDHSESKKAKVKFLLFPNKIEFTIIDDGIGIFNKITQVFNLEDHRHAILELAKGKLTTDPKNHTGEGIFFTSRMFDEFAIRSGKLFFYRFKNNDWLIENKATEFIGTLVNMSISTGSETTPREVFEKYSAEKDEYGFTKTYVPVELLKYGNENLVSRSQAKRLMAGLERFKEVVLNFKGVNFIGQGFADEIFRVFKSAHPHIEILVINTNDDVKKMIKRAEEEFEIQQEFHFEEK